MMTLISWVNGIYGLVSCIQRFQLLLQKAPQNAWKYFKVIWKSQGILFCLTCGNPVCVPVCAVRLSSSAASRRVGSRHRRGHVPRHRHILDSSPADTDTHLSRIHADAGVPCGRRCTEGLSEISVLFVYNNSTLSVIGVGSPGRSSSGSVPGISSRFILGYTKASGDSPPIMLSLPSRQPIFVSTVRLHVEPTASCC